MMGWWSGRRNKFESFWEWFQENEETYFEFARATREKEMNRLFKRLQKVNKHLAYEFSDELIDGKREFIISAEGITDAFDDVLELFGAAPELERFEIIPFRQPSSEGIAISYGNVDVTWDDVFFTDDSGNLDLTIYAKGFTDANKDDYIPALFILLDSVIGEFYVGTRIGEIVFTGYEGEPEAKPIADLREAVEAADQAKLELDFLPPTLKKLREFDKMLQAEGLSLDEGIGLRWADESLAYDQTPYDVLPFMDAGVDGIHVGLLTDFGKVTNLEEAFVVCVHPMNAPDSLQLLARNPKEFVDFLYSDRNLVMLYNFMMIDSEERYRAMLQESEQDIAESPELEETRNRVLQKLKEYMNCERIDNLYEYVEHTVAAARTQQTVLPTADGLGIAAVDKTGGELPRYPVSDDEDISVEDARAFFASAPAESKLAFIRDAQRAGLIDNATPLKGFIVAELGDMGLDAEIKRLKSLDW